MNTTLQTASNSRLEKLFQHLDPKRGRLSIIVDATNSRQETWDVATGLTGQMFETVAQTGGLDAQLIYFRGYGECLASKWTSDARALRAIMTTVTCRAGPTQIRRAFGHVRKEHSKQPVDAVVYIGDACEEIPADVYDATCQVPVFMFQEGNDKRVHEIFATIAKLTRGAHVQFNTNSSVTLAELLKAVAAFATGGVKALANQTSEAARLLLTQVKK